MKLFPSIVSVLLIPCVAVLPLAGQASVPGAADASPSALQVTLVPDPSHSKVLAGSQLAEGLSVDVKNAAGQPVPNAAVVFRLPDGGASGAFADGTAATVVYSDTAGRANAGAIRWGTVPGIVSLRVTAAKGTAHAGLLIEETLAAPPSTPSTPVPVAAPIPAPMPVIVSPPASQKVSGIPPSWKIRPGVNVEHPLALNKHPQSAMFDDEDTDPAPPQATPAVADDSPDANVPIRHTFHSGAESGETPGVSVTTNSGASEHSGHFNKKWIFVIVAAAGAGAAVAMMHKGSGPSSAASGVNIGAPTISVGHP